MPHYDFKKDIVVAKRTEQEVARVLEKACAAKILEFNDSNLYDIRAVIGEEEFTYEVKEDFTCSRTGNVGLEFSCRGKNSGIRVCQADYYIYKIHRSPRMIVYIQHETKELKRKVFVEEYFRVVNGGDPGSNSINYLFKYETFIKNGKILLLVLTNPENCDIIDLSNLLQCEEEKVIG